MNSDNFITILGLHPQSERPYKILSCPIPGLKEEDIIPQVRLEAEDSSEIGQSLESRNIGLNSEEVEVADERSEQSLSQRRYNASFSSQRELDLIRTKEKIIAVTFIQDSMPSYILVITKVYKPQNSTAENS